MAVYFVYRCHYGSPSEKHVRRFEYDSVLDWARGVFRQFPDRKAADTYSAELLGGLDVYSFGSLFELNDDGSERELPETMHDVRAWFGAMYVDEQQSGPHHIQIYTDDDELEMAAYVFDDHYRAATPGKADFLLLDGWELPDGTAEGSFRPPAVALREPMGTNIDPADVPGPGGAVSYATFLAFYDSTNLDLDGGYRVSGARVPDLARCLLTDWVEGELDSTWEQLRDALLSYLGEGGTEDEGFLVTIRNEPEEETNWKAYADWLQERDQPAPGIKLLRAALERVTPRSGSTRDTRDPKKDLRRITPHMVQVCFHSARWGNDDLYHQWIFFDDLWAAAHPTLATGILTFAARWDVLT